MAAPLLTGLTLLACLSPLLTFAAFWQVKEWRPDRLREELLRERSFLSLIGGKIRPAVVVAFFFLLVVIPVASLPILAALGALDALTVAQFLLRRQRMPVWTSKAKTLVGFSLILDAAAAWLLSQVPLGWIILPVLPLLQAATLALSWAAFLPVDHALKRQIMAKAKTRRDAHPELTVIGITGSVGKTTTKELLAHILQVRPNTQHNQNLVPPSPSSEGGQQGEGSGAGGQGDRGPMFTPAHVNSEVGVAQWILKHLPTDPLPQGTPLIVEMGAYRAGEVAELCAFVRPSIGIVTFIGSQHLALFGSQEALIKAKGELLVSLPETGHAFLNGDCERCREMARFCRCPVTVVGTGGPGDLEAYDIEETTTGIRFAVGEVPFAVPLHGTHNVVNVLLTIAVAEHLGMARQAIAERLRTFRPPHRTFEVRQESGITILDDTHNASATSFKAAIAWAKSQPFAHRTLLTNGIIELGEEHERTHRELGALAAEVFQNVIFLDRRSASFFTEGFGKPITVLNKNTVPIPPDSLLVCVGRMSPATIGRLLPQQ